MFESYIYSGYTRRAEEEFGDKSYGGRPLIGRDTVIHGGVYYGIYGGEAIVVDPANDPDIYSNWMSAAADLIGGPVSDERAALRAVFKTVSDRMTYSENGVQATLEKVAQLSAGRESRDGDKVDLSVFMHEGVGVCRHQALACGFILEAFSSEGILRGETRVLRNAIKSPDPRIYGGHAWTQYTTPSGFNIVLDVAQNYIGSPDNSAETPWRYQLS